MEFEIGKMVKIRGVDLIVLDIIEGNPFVIALNTGIKTEFGESNDYLESDLKKKCDKWIKDLQIPTIDREVDLNHVFNSNPKEKHSCLALSASPLTFDEYRKYSVIITPHIKDIFWLCSPWNKNLSFYVCVVSSDGFANGGGYGNYYDLAPAFIIDAKAEFNTNEENKTSEKIYIDEACFIGYMDGLYKHVQKLNSLYKMFEDPNKEFPTSCKFLYDGADIAIAMIDRLFGNPADFTLYEIIRNMLNEKNTIKDDWRQLYNDWIKR